MRRCAGVSTPDRIPSTNSASTLRPACGAGTPAPSAALFLGNGQLDDGALPEPRLKADEPHLEAPFDDLTDVGDLQRLVGGVVAVDDAELLSGAVEADRAGGLALLLAPHPADLLSAVHVLPGRDDREGEKHHVP